MTTTEAPTNVNPETRQRIEATLAKGGVIDITTRGKRSGEPRRIEIVFFNLGGRVVISGMPGRRGWYANLLADPTLTFHLKRGVEADLPAQARPITDDAERRELLTPITRQWRRDAQLERFVSDSPLVEITFEDESLAA
jgi:deazaflavin-dependent oxidoreductase (nitroreductase family)